VQRLLGPGLLESIYEEALAVELALRGIACTRQVAIDVTSKDIPSKVNDSIFWWRMR
jgi:GxxExxY protein